MRRGVHDGLAVREEITAGRPAPLTELLLVRPVDVHGEDLVTGICGAWIGLIDQLPAIRREIGLGVFPACCQLPDVPQVPLLRWRSLTVRKGDEKQSTGHGRGR